MGLFKKKATPQEFFTACLKKTHDLAMNQGFVKGGVKFIPELLPYGNRLLQSDLKSEAFTSMYADNVKLLQALSDSCMMYGIILADTWHRHFSDLQMMAVTIEIEGPNGHIQNLVEGELNFTPQKFNQWLGTAFVTCLNEFCSIRGGDNKHLLTIPLVCYQLGISIMLSHYGF